LPVFETEWIRYVNKGGETSKHGKKPGPNHGIGTLGEKSLHSALKDWYAQRGDRIESEVEGFHIDIIRHNLLVEIQTANFSSLKHKLNRLIRNHPLRLVYPIAQEKWILRLAADGKTRLGRRKSPRRGHVFHLFQELVSIPDLIMNPNFSLEVLMIQEEEIRCDDGAGSWRRNGLSIADRCLIKVLSQHLFEEPPDFLSLIPPGMKEPYSTKELAEGIGEPRWIAQKMAYCLRSMGMLEIVGKNGNSLLYSASNTAKA
jgi:hypothetical protein